MGVNVLLLKQADKVGDYINPIKLAVPKNMDRWVEKVVSKHSAERYIWGGDCVGWHLLKSPGLSVIQERVPLGHGEIRHYHQHAHQFFFVLSGCATLEVDGQVLKVVPYQGCSVPPQLPHQLSNEDTADLEFIVVSSPLSHGDRIELKQEKPRQRSILMNSAKSRKQALLGKFTTLYERIYEAMYIRWFK